MVQHPEKDLKRSGQCPDNVELQRYLQGWMDEQDYLRTDSHVLSCAICESTIAGLEDTEDSLTAALRARGAALPPASGDDSAIAGALQTSRELMDQRPVVASMRNLEQKVIGSYELQQPIGRGGMGAVYLARHSELGKQVAIKLLPAIRDQRDEVRTRFQREVQAVGSLDDPRIVAATDAGEADGTQYLVMEYIDGLDLSRLVKACGRLRIADACEIMRQAALGLSTAHAAGIVHRDIKPSNVMLDEQGRVKILDFGLAQLGHADEASFELTTVGQLLGTLDYMAPEQADRSGVVDYRADLYSLGATLFRLLTGRAPLAATPNQSPLEKLRLLATHAAPKLSSLRDDAPDDLVALLSSLLNQHPENRAASAAHVAEQLEPFCDGADLIPLLAHARQCEAANPEAVSVAADPVFTDPTTQARKPRARRWLMWLALLPLVVLGGVLITIETQKGQIVIESEVPDVQVRIVQDGKAVEDLTVDQQPEATRLRAGKYEVILKGKSDGLVVKDGSFTLMSRGTKIARIVRKVASEPAGDPIVSSNADSAVKPAAKPEPTFEGKSLTKWLKALETERSPKAIHESLKAVDALVVEERATEITSVTINALKLTDGTFTIETDGTPHTDYWGFHVLRKANPGKRFYKMALRELKSDAEELWKGRLFKQLRIGDARTQGEWSEVFEWTVDYLAREDVPTTWGSLHVEIRDHYVKLVNDRFEFLEKTRNLRDADGNLDEDYQEVIDDETAKRMAQALIDSPVLRKSPNWWLRLGPGVTASVNMRQLNLSERRNFVSGRAGVVIRAEHLSPLFAKEIRRQATAILADVKSSPSLVMHAAIFLTANPPSEQERPDVLRHLSNAIRHASAKQYPYETLDLERRYQGWAIPQIENVSVGRSMSYSGNVLIELLDLAAALGDNGALEAGLAAVHQRFGEGKHAPREDLFAYITNWPSLEGVYVQTRTTRRDSGRRGVRGNSTASREGLTLKEAFGQLIGWHPVMRKYREQHGLSDDGRGSVGSGPTIATLATHPLVILKFKPRLPGVNCDSPETARVEVSGDKRELTAKDDAGTMLRKFMDTNGDGTIDTWICFARGTETYREVDTDLDGTVDLYRITKGNIIREGTDNNGDGKVDEWRESSAK